MLRVHAHNKSPTRASMQTVARKFAAFASRKALEQRFAGDAVGETTTGQHEGDWTTLSIPASGRERCDDTIDACNDAGTRDWRASTILIAAGAILYVNFNNIGVRCFILIGAPKR